MKYLVCPTLLGKCWVLFSFARPQRRKLGLMGECVVGARWAERFGWTLLL